MIGMVLVSHGDLGASMLAVVEHVLGPQALTASMCVKPDSDMVQDRKHLLKLVKRCDTGDGVLLFADMFGGTPCNMTLSCMQEESVEIISGFNLPMLITAASKRQSMDRLSELAREVLESGRHHIHLVSELLNAQSHA